jgi:hypothetical protein
MTTTTLTTTITITSMNMVRDTLRVIAMITLTIIAMITLMVIATGMTTTTASVSDIITIPSIPGT